MDDSISRSIVRRIRALEDDNRTLHLHVANATEAAEDARDIVEASRPSAPVLRSGASTFTMPHTAEPTNAWARLVVTVMLSAVVASTFTSITLLIYVAAVIALLGA